MLKAWWQKIICCSWAPAGCSVSYSIEHTGGFTTEHTGGWLGSPQVGSPLSTPVGLPLSTGGFTTEHTGGSITEHTGGFINEHTGGFTTEHTGGFTTKPVTMWQCMASVLPDRRLPSQMHSITALLASTTSHCLVTEACVLITCPQSLHKRKRPAAEPATSWLQIWYPDNYMTMHQITAIKRK